MLTFTDPVADAEEAYEAMRALAIAPVLGLREGDDVRMAGVRVGKVDKIELARDDRALGEVNDAPRQYLNRLSDLLFVLARVLNRMDGGDDVYWKSERMARASA